jgi:hypothetical protein
MLLPSTGRRLMAAGLRRAGLREQASIVDAMARNGACGPIAGERQPFVDAIVDTIEARNQMHMGGFLFRKFLGLPVIKRDIYFREIHSLDEIARALADLDMPLRDEIMRDVARRGTTADFGFWRKVLSRHSAA